MPSGRSVFDEVKEAHARELALYRRELGRFATEFEWHHLVDLTSRWPDADLLWGEFAIFIRRLENKAQRRVTWLSVMEGCHAGHPHLHVLVHGTIRMPVSSIQCSWTLGYSRAKCYADALAGAYYISKQVNMTDECRWGCSKRLPPRLRRRSSGSA